MRVSRKNGEMEVRVGLARWELEMGGEGAPLQSPDPGAHTRGAVLKLPGPGRCTRDPRASPLAPGRHLPCPLRVRKGMRLMAMGTVPCLLWKWWTWWVVLRLDETRAPSVAPSSSNSPSRNDSNGGGGGGGGRGPARAGGRRGHPPCPLPPGGISARGRPPHSPMAGGGDAGLRGPAKPPSGC